MQKTKPDHRESILVSVLLVAFLQKKILFYTKIIMLVYLCVGQVSKKKKVS